VSDPSFLTLDEVLLLHEISLTQFGGSTGIRDEGGLESAVEQPKNTYFYGGGDLFDVAAAYAFHIAQAQAFLDGNKRTAVAAALNFLRGNGVAFKLDRWELYRHMIAIAERRSLLVTARSLRLEMLQVARVAPKLLGDSAPLVEAFLRRQLGPHGGGLDRDGREDLYYTIFTLAALHALQAELPVEKVTPYLRSFGTGESLDFIHLGALARCWSAIGLQLAPPDLPATLAAPLEKHRTPDGGYHADLGHREGDAYGAFIALGSYQDLGLEIPNPLALVQSLKFLETRDGAWSNARHIPVGATPATAAAITVLHQLGMPINSAAGEWLKAQQHAEGGFLAVPNAPLPDLLSTATALHALATLEMPLSDRQRERCLDYIDTLWNAEGGFHGHWADDHLDAEYTFYGLLALGHLAV
jgi:death-on-curing family protein